MSAHAPSAAGGRLERSASGRVLAGVCAGLAGALGVDVALVRILFLGATLIGGLGPFAYLVAWALMPAAGTPTREEWRARRAMVAGTLIVVAALNSFPSRIGLALPPGVMIPATLACVGAALIWRRRGGEVRVGALGEGLPGATRAVAGVLLVGAGVALAVAQSGGIGPVLAAALAAGIVAAGIGLLVRPSLQRARAEADAQRRERIVAEERERVANRLHDSVLQTLALIQREPDADRVRALARRQDRELRAWLYGGEDADAHDTLGAALRGVVGDVEDAYRIRIGLVQPADVPMDDRMAALVDATREAVTNAAKHSGADQVNVLVRVAPDRVRVFVDDRGLGFDTGAVPADRRGVRDSIRGRLARVGGEASISSKPGGGTDVELSVPRESPS